MGCAPWRRPVANVTADCDSEQAGRRDRFSKRMHTDRALRATLSAPQL